MFTYMLVLFLEVAIDGKSLNLVYQNTHEAQHLISNLNNCLANNLANIYTEN